jgi:hypothetical protein
MEQYALSSEGSDTSLGSLEAFSTDAFELRLLRNGQPPQRERPSSAQLRPSSAQVRAWLRGGNRLTPQVPSLIPPERLGQHTGDPTGVQ